MGLYKLFSYNVEVQYKSCLFSKAMLFTVATTLLNIILPFLIAYRSRGFWLKTHNFYEQPSVHFTYDYLLVAETADLSRPIVCGDAAALDEHFRDGDENCAEMQVQEYDSKGNGKNDVLDFTFQLQVEPHRTITSVILIISLDFQLKSVCPLHMQSLAVINKQFISPFAEVKYYGDLQFYQISHLPCAKNHIDTRHNTSLLSDLKKNNENIIDFILGDYYSREVITQVKTIHSRNQNGYTGKSQLNIRLRVPEMEIKYLPNLLQELKWAWPQYLSLVIVFYWFFTKIKRFVFNNRLLMAWEVIPWKNQK